MGLEERFIGRVDGGNFAKLNFFNLNLDPENTFTCSVIQTMWKSEIWNLEVDTGKISSLVKLLDSYHIF